MPVRAKAGGFFSLPFPALLFALRHGGDQQRVDLEERELVSPANSDHLLAVNEALDKLAAHHPAEAELVKLRYFLGMTNEQAAEALGISLRTAKCYWTHGRAWLYREVTASRNP